MKNNLVCMGISGLHEYSFEWIRYLLKPIKNKYLKH